MKLLTKWFAPYTIFFTDCFGRSEIHYSWTLRDALEWVSCSLRDEDVCVYKYHNLVAFRSITEEV